MEDDCLSAKVQGGKVRMQRFTHKAVKGEVRGPQDGSVLFDLIYFVVLGIGELHMIYTVTLLLIYLTARALFIVKSWVGQKRGAKGRSPRPQVRGIKLDEL